MAPVATLQISRGTAIRALVSLVVLVVVFGWLLPRVIDGQALWADLQGIPRRWWIGLVPLGVFNLLTPAFSQRAALPKLSLGEAAESDWSTSALSNTVPGGGAVAVGLTAAMYRSYGLGPRDIAQAVTLTGIFDTAIKLISPLVAVTWLSTQQPVSAGLIQAAAIGVFLAIIGTAVAVAVLRPGPLPRLVVRQLNRMGRFGRRAAERLPNLQIDAAAAFADRSGRLFLWSVAGQVGLMALLWASIRAVGIPVTELSVAAIFVALSFGRLITAIPLTPGGLGPMEAGLIGALAAAGGADTDSIAAAVVVFRAWTFAAPIPLGAASLLIWRVRTRSSGAT